MNNKKTMYADGSGDFRPERIKHIIDKNLDIKDHGNTFLKNIAFQRIYELDDVLKLIRKIRILNFDLLVLDDIIPLFLYKFKDKTRLEVRRFVRELSLMALSRQTSIIFTNTVTEKFNRDLEGIGPYELFYHDIIRYVHYKFLLKPHPKNKRTCELRLIHPVATHNFNALIDIWN